MASLVSIQIGQPADYQPVLGDTSDKPWRTAFYKEPVFGKQYVTRLGLKGDGVADPKHHGGTDKAICVYSADHFDYWRNDLDLGEEFGPAAFGENFTVEGFVETNVNLGDVWQIGEVTIQVSQPRQPCWKLARRWKQKDLTLRVQENGFTGWYLRVLTEGQIEPGEEITLSKRPLPDWPLERANQVMHHQRKDRAAAAELAAVELLAASWREELLKRVAKDS